MYTVQVLYNTKIILYNIKISFKKDEYDHS